MPPFLAFPLSLWYYPNNFTLPLLPHSLMARQAIFTSEEQKLFSSPPVFNSIERKRYFTFPTGILETARKLDKPHNRVYFLLMYGYFKATNKFYQRKFHQKDIVPVS